MSESIRDLVIVRAKLELPVTEGITEWRFVTIRDGDKVTFGKIEPVVAGLDHMEDSAGKLHRAA